MGSNHEKKKTFALLLLLACLTVTAAAANGTESSGDAGIEKVELIEMVINQRGIVSVSEKMTFAAGGTVSRAISSDAHDIYVLDSKTNPKAFKSTPSAGEEKAVISFILENNSAGEEEIVLKYTTDQLTSKSGDTWQMNFSSSFTPRTTIIKLIFPKNWNITVISIEPTNMFLTPVSSSEIWFYPQETNQSFSFRYKVNGNLEETPVEVPQTYTYEIFIAVIAVLALLAVFLMFRNRKLRKSRAFVVEDQGTESMEIDHVEEITTPEAPVTGTLETEEEAVEAKEAPIAEEPEPAPAKEVAVAGKSPKKGNGRIKEDILALLDVNELKIIKILEESKEEITQAYVYKSTGIPKSSLSDIIKRLEKRNLIEVTKEGRTNWIKLKEWLFE